MKPSELIADAIKKYPEEKWLDDALTKATGNFESRSYFRCVLDKDWSAKENYCLPFRSERYGFIVLDIQPENIIGGIELVDLIDAE